MNTVSLPSLHIKEHVLTLLYYRILIVSVVILLLGGALAVGIVYIFGFRVPVAPPDVVVVSPHGAVSNGAIDNIAQYATVKQQDAAAVPAYPGAVFFIPPKAP